MLCSLDFRPWIGLLVLAVLLAGETGARAQATDPASRLSDRDAEILARGLYTQKEVIWGGLLGSTLGFGTGHAYQGRWKETGWIFTAAETASLVGLLAGTAACATEDPDDDGFEGIFETTDCFLTVGLIASGVFLGFRVAEFIDVWAHPQIHNRRFRRLEEDRARTALRWTPFVAPIRGGGASAGLAFRF